jgi:hypothetical protein
MTTTAHSHRAGRRLDVAGLMLFLVGLTSGVAAYWLVTAHGLNPLVIVPAVVAATTGAAHLTKRQVPRG